MLVGATLATWEKPVLLEHNQAQTKGKTAWRAKQDGGGVQCRTAHLIHCLACLCRDASVAEDV